ncbi:MAG: dTDP-4-dehydrorhamnose reductase [Acidobacteria bacterium]|jgi:dTDP-4-dehydrorhamnose reductase|nr:dTDP-4-dehydrorhamnose reductase [Acidobacteriota bacterium]
MRIAVTGAKGQLGAAILHECSGAHQITAFSRAELDISDEAAVAAAMARVEPEAIVNAAAFTNVDAAEDHPIEALNANAFGVRALARAAVAHGATLVHYSTDFVFDGKTASPYTELDRPAPQSVYAASKLLGEWFAQDAPQAYVLRVEGIFGETAGAGPAKGSAAAILNGLRAGVDVKVFEDRIITPSYASDVAGATRRLIESRPAAGLYHCVNSGPTTWYEFALEMARLIGVEPRLTRVRMADMNLRAIRPVYCALSNDKLRAIGIDMPPWQDALRRYLQ